MSYQPSLTPYLPRQGIPAMTGLQDKALELSTLAAELAGMLAPAVRTVLTHHMKVINSYYSSLIEGERSVRRRGVITVRTLSSETFN